MDVFLKISLLAIPVLIFALIVFFFVFWIKMIIHAASHEVENKTVWIIVLVVFGFLAAIAYYFVVKRKFVPAPATIPMPAPEPVNTVSTPPQA